MTTTKLVILLAAAALSASQATTIQWLEDGDSSFNVVIAGQGLTWHDTFISPSGLWEFDFWLSGHTFETNDGRDWVVVHDTGYATFCGLPECPSLLAPGYDDFFPAVPGLIYDSNHFTDLARQSLEDWRGFTPYVISVENPADPSGWNWVLNLYASGPAPLAQHVPDGGSTLLLGMMGLAGLGIARKTLIP